MRAAPRVQRLWLICVITVTTLGLVWFSASVQATEQESIDIPLGHWSYAAVESLAQTPLVAKSDVLFDNQTSVTRYEMALIVAKILRRLDDLGTGLQESEGSLVSGGVEQEVLDELFAAAKQSDPGKGTLTDEHLQLIKRLVEGFNSELRALGLIRPSTSAADFDLLFDPSAYRLRGGEGSARSIEAEDEDPFRLSGWRSVISSDSTLWKKDGWELGASVSKLLDGAYYEGYDPFDPEGSPKTKAVTALEGKLQVTPGVRVSGEYATNPESSDDASSMKVGAQMKVGDVEVGASYKNVRPQFDPLFKSGIEGKEATGYEVSLQYRDVVLSTGRETQTTIGETGKEPETVTSVGLEYGVRESLVLRADYRYVDIDELINEDPSSTRRSTVGVGVSVPKGSVSLGLIYEQEASSGRVSTKGASADIAHKAPWDSESVLQAGVALEDMNDNKKTTSLSLGYNYRKEAALVFGYKLIDFTESGDSVDGSENVATAELSIKF